MEPQLKVHLYSVVLLLFLKGDAKYALHQFKYTKSSSKSRTVKVTDYYDFASGDYNGLEGLAVEAMVNAQKNGSIVPYNVSITVTVN